jgi:hypothetical protein
MKNLRRPKNVGLDLEELVGRGRPGEKKVRIDARIIYEPAKTICVQTLPVDRKLEKSAKQRDFEKILVDALSFEEKFWSFEEWREMLGLVPSHHWADRLLLLSRAQVRVVGKSLDNTSYVLLPDGAVFSTRLLRPPRCNQKLSENPLTRVPPMVVLCALEAFRVQLKAESEAATEDPSVSHKRVAGWLERWLCGHKATRWWLQGVAPAESQDCILSDAEEEKRSPLLVTADHVTKIYGKLRGAGLGTYIPQHD